MAYINFKVALGWGMKQGEKREEKGNPLLHVQVGRKVISYPNKPPPLGILSRAAGGDNDQVKNDKNNLFFLAFSPVQLYFSSRLAQSPHW